ncbi:MAG: hypothetical protein IPL32_20315 [Chloracidobacterium sp.]|nr:hypothetical protein [Chloracidobacterium sp.]
MSEIHIQPSMFDERMIYIPPPGADPTACVINGNPRQAVIDAALDAAHEEWKAAYERYILTFASVAHEPFSAEDVRLRYEQSHGPQTKKQQASGGIFQRLQKQGKLIAVGKKRSKKIRQRSYKL